MVTREDKEQCKTLGKTRWIWKEVLINTLPLKLGHKEHDASYNLSPATREMRTSESSHCAAFEGLKSP